MLTTLFKNLGSTAFLAKKLRTKLFSYRKVKKTEKGRFFTTLIVFLPGISTWSKRLFLSTLMGSRGAAANFYYVPSLLDPAFFCLQQGYPWGSWSFGGNNVKGLKVLFWVFEGVALGYFWIFYVLFLFFFFSKDSHWSTTEQWIKLQMGCGNWLQTSLLANVKDIDGHTEFINAPALCPHKLAWQLHPERDQVPNSFCSIFFKTWTRNVWITMSKETSVEQVIWATDFQLAFQLSFGNLSFGRACKFSTQPNTGTPGTNSKHQFSIVVLLFELFSYFILCL